MIVTTAVQSTGQHAAKRSDMKTDSSLNLKERSRKAIHLNDHTFMLILMHPWFWRYNCKLPYVR